MIVSAITAVISTYIDKTIIVIVTNPTNSFLLGRLFTFPLQQLQIIFSHALSLYKAKLN